MTQAVKGKKGFQVIPKEEQRTVRKSYHLTQAESDLLDYHLQAKGITHSQLIRTLLKDLIGRDAE